MQVRWEQACLFIRPFLPLIHLINIAATADASLSLGLDGFVTHKVPAVAAVAACVSEAEGLGHQQNDGSDV